MPEEGNKAVVRRFYEEVFNAGRLEAMDELVSPDLAAHDTLPPGVPERGPEPYKHTAAMFRSAFPDLHQEIEDMVAEGDKVAVRVTMTATHRGPFLGVAPTDRRVRYEGMDFFRFREGKMVEHWTATDDLGLMQQLGVVPSSEPWSRPLPE
jgi:steroid delta-isomerase-like uncharacterized protein